MPAVMLITVAGRPRITAVAPAPIALLTYVREEGRAVAAWSMSTILPALLAGKSGAWRPCTG